MESHNETCDFLLFIQDHVRANRANLTNWESYSSTGMDPYFNFLNSWARAIYTPFEINRFMKTFLNSSHSTGGASWAPPSFKSSTNHLPYPTIDKLQSPPVLCWDNSEQRMVSQSLNSWARAIYTPEKRRWLEFQKVCHLDLSHFPLPRLRRKRRCLQYWLSIPYG